MTNISVDLGLRMKQYVANKLHEGGFYRCRVHGDTDKIIRLCLDGTVADCCIQCLQDAIDEKQ